MLLANHSDKTGVSINITGRLPAENFNMPDLQIQTPATKLTGAMRGAALLLLENRTPEAEAALSAAMDGDAVMCVAMRGGAIVGAAMAQLQPGRIAMAWPPRCANEEPASTSWALLQELLERLRESGVQLVQAFPDAPSQADQQLFEAAGFEHLADLLYLVSTDADFPDVLPALEAALEPYSEANHRRLLDVLDRTYEGTLDCPRLNGVRAAEDVLATYRRTIDFDPTRWFLVRLAGEDVGCLLLGDHPRDEQWELIYVGLVASARGRGLGRQLVRQAQWLTRQAGRGRLVLSVDAANAPALGLYASEGFVAWDRRAIYLRIFTDRPAAG
jgi:ribosomal protein S18 acetylase RimI-like enzyme